VSQAYKPDDIEILIQDFERSGMRELHLRCDEFELYLSTDPNGRGIESAYESRTDSAAAAQRSPAAAAEPAGIDASTSTAVLHATAAAGVTAPAAVLIEQQWPDNATVVRAPYLGTFYRSPKPGSKPYVETGDAVTAESDLCLVEVMKLFTAVRAGIAGRVHAVLAKDGQLVEGNQPLFVLVPV
jgi:acetyl-CoA carboxylase biotin carboxyl carrier protein